MLRIGIDGGLLCGSRTGMGTVVYNVLPFWKTDENVHITLYLPEPPDSALAEKLRENGIETIILGRHNYFSWEQKVLPKAVKNDGIDVLWCPYNTAPLNVKCRTVLSVHDIIYMSASLGSAHSLYKKLGIIYRRMNVPKAVKKAAQIITVSRFSASEITRTFRSAEGKLSVIYHGSPDPEEYQEDNETEEFPVSCGITKPYILGFGSLESRKNSFMLIKVFEDLPDNIKNTYKLVLFGFRGYEGSEQYRYIKEHNIGNIVVLGYVSEKEKEMLYRKAQMFVFPSLSEGFGIPVLEAFANGTPVITSDTTSLPEVAGDAAILTDPTDADALSRAIIQLAQDSGLCERLSEAGRTRAEKFDWSTAAEQIMSVLLKA